MSESLSFEGPLRQPDEPQEATEGLLDAHKAFEKVSSLRDKAAELHEHAGALEDTTDILPPALGASGFAFNRASAGLQAFRRLYLHSKADRLEDKADRIARTESEKT